jgi:hypothetical protein
MLYDCFLVHSSVDKDLARRVHDGLIAAQRRVFFDAEALRAGDRYDQVIPEAQAASAVSVVLITSAFMRGPYARAEVARAITLREAGGHRVVPVRFGVGPQEVYGLETTHAPEVADAEQAVEEILLALGEPTPAPGGGPLVRPLVHLDRIHAWSDLTARCKSTDRHQLFLVHGPPSQALAEFSARVFKDLPRHAGPHTVCEVDVDGQAYEGPPDSALKWRSRVANALGDRGGVVELLRQRSVVAPVLLAFGRKPLSCRVHTPREIAALADYLRDGLAGAILEAAPAHKVRVYVAVEEVGREWSNLLDAALGDLANAIHAGRVRRGQRIGFPAWEEVAQYIGLQPVVPTEDWWDNVQEQHRQIEEDSKNFLEFCEVLDRWLQKLPRTG